ncbi:Rdx family protein [Oceanirhabdus sp. W0125-5]|nr:Rdx family protein [Oceanirhabdus sp. W0125-5]WBW99811.1 Rdx family protein [Oceanirhabdus sp. W0125-5]
MSSLNLIPSSGGVFKIRYNKDLLFSKNDYGRFPEENEIEKLLKEKINIL